MLGGVDGLGPEAGPWGVLHQEAGEDEGGVKEHDDLVVHGGRHVRRPHVRDAPENLTPGGCRCSGRTGGCHYC